ncbi:MAG: tape measure protein [Candidatus Limnocylindrus sp.]
MAVMDALLKIRATVDGTSAITKLGDALGGVTGNAKTATTAAGSLGSAFRTLGAAVSTVGLGAVGKGLLDAGVQAQTTDRRIEALAGSFGEVSKIEELASRAARTFAIGTTDARNAVADLYGRLRPTGVSLKDIETVFFGVNNAAKTAGLGVSETSGVMLQLSQALGSGKLQGDELRSIMEQLPAVGQAVSKVMGVTVGEIKELGADGKITTDVMIKAAAALREIKPPPPTATDQFSAAIKNLNTELGENLLPLVTPLIEGLTNILKVFGALPEPVQTVVVGLGAVALAVGAIVTAIGVAAPILAGFAAAIGGLSLGATIAGWAAVAGPAITAITAAFSGLLTFLTGTFLPAIVTFFSGPVGWTVLAVAAVVAMAIAFREPIMKFLGWLGKIFTDTVVTIGKGVFDLFLKPWVELFNIGAREPVVGMLTWLQATWAKAVNFISTALRNVANAARAPFLAVVETIRGAMNGVLRFITGGINAAVRAINVLISAYNRLPTPDIPLVPSVGVPQFAEGGVVDRPTLAMVGEGGEREYIIPESKMGAASAAYLAGTRGGAVLGTTTAAAVINITTGPVLQQDGQQWVTLRDLERAMRATEAGTLARIRTPAGRSALGIR